MIKNTFVFLERISKRTELRLWQQGIKDWNDFINKPSVKGITPEKKAYYDRQLQLAQQALSVDNSAFFLGKLPAKETWRLYDFFSEQAAYLDLEIDSRGKIILVGISDYYHTNTFVAGVNLEKTILEKELSKFKLLITFNGASFDLPKLKKQLHLEINIPHLDLKPLCVKLGLKGGLKEIERKLNLQRPSHLMGSPVDLWKAFHASGDREYLDLLIHYNQEDVENLKLIADHVNKEMKRILPFPN